MKLPMIIQKALQHIRYRLFHISPETILRIEFRIRTGYSLNIKNPKLLFSIAEFIIDNII